MRVSRFSEIFPGMSEAEYAALRKSIREHGLLEPIVLTSNRILDGRHRFAACQAEGVKPRFRHLDGKKIDEVQYVVAANLVRRHLTESQRALIAAELESGKWGRPRKLSKTPAKTGNLAESKPETRIPQGENKEARAPLFREEAAKLLKVGQTSVKQAQAVLKSAPAEVVEAVRKGAVSVRDAALVSKQTKAVQRKALARVEAGEHKKLGAAANALERERMRKSPPSLPQGKYRVVVIDPPWPVEKIEREAAPNQHGLDYPTMSLEEIRDLPVGDFLAEDAWVCLWTTNKFLPAAFMLLDHWSLKYRFTMVWQKPGGFQPFGYPQLNAEFIVCAAHGKPKLTDLKDFKVAFTADRGRHSEKPDVFYQRVKRVMAGPRLDMFARKKRDGFRVWGNEV